MTSERPVEIETDTSKILGMLHTPQNNDDMLPLVIILHGHGGNKLGPGRFFVESARELCEDELAVLRFDFRGSGDSQEPEEKQTTTTMINDLERVIEYVSKLKEIDGDNIHLIGHSWGGYIGIQYASKNEKIKSLILWMARTYDLDQSLGRPWIDELDRKGFFYDKDVKFTKKFYEDGKKYSAEGAIEDLSIPVGMIYGNFDKIVLPSDGQHLIENAQTEAKMEIMETLDHYFQGEPNRQQVLEYTKTWLEKWVNK